jgi:uncharacterized RDD family membrane protein YckC
VTESVSTADCKARRIQSAADVFMSVLLAMMIWPFPVARALMSPAAHVAGVLATCLIVLLVYFSVSAAAWRQTLGMRLAGVRLESIEGDAPTRAQGLKWGLVSAVVAPWYIVAPASACSASIAERVSRTTVCR